MKHRGVPLSILILASATANAAKPIVVGTQGMGAARFGMSVAQFSKALGQKFAEPQDPEDRGCFYLEPKKFPDVAFMFEEGRLQRIDVRSTKVATADGIRVGDPVDSVKAKYGSHLVDEPHHYSGPEDRYLTLSLSASIGVRFETDGPRVGNFYVGGLKQIQYVEGCL